MSGPQAKRPKIAEERDGTPAARLRSLLQQGDLITTPCCGDALSARLIESAGCFKAMFMSGFCVAAGRGMPDTQLISYAEMRDTLASVCEHTTLPVIADGDTGYGNAVNVKRTVRGYAQAGAACVMIEDQLAPKRCGHVGGKTVVGREEAFARVKAAVDARDEGASRLTLQLNLGANILIMARTDARGTDGIDEAIFRCKRFVELGADVTFLEAPHSKEEMERYCREVPGPKMANMLETGATPCLPPGELHRLGYTIAAHPITLLSAAVRAMKDALARIRDGVSAEDLMLRDFDELKDAVGFGEYFKQADKYAGPGTG